MENKLIEFWTCGDGYIYSLRKDGIGRINGSRKYRISNRRLMAIADLTLCYIKGDLTTIKVYKP